MKKLFLILCLFIAPTRASSFAPVLSGLQSGPIGIVFSDDFTRADSATVGNSWVEEDSVDASIASNRLRLVGGTATTRVRQPYLQHGENYTYRIRFTMTAVNGAATYGPVLGGQIRTSILGGGTQRGYCAQLVCSSGANFGKLVLYKWTGSAYTSLATTAGSIAHTAGDVIELTFTLSKYTISGTAKNITQGSATLSQSFTLLDTPANVALTNLVPGPRDPVIFALGGTVDISIFEITLNANTRGTIFIGDSITQGCDSGGLANRWVSLVAAAFPNEEFYGFGAASGTVESALLALPEMIKYNPRRAYLMIGGNDVALGTASATWQANYASLVAGLEAIGCDFVHCYPTPRDSVDVTPVKTYQIATYPAGKLVDTWTPLWQGSGTGITEADEIGDNIHPNTTGHAKTDDPVAAHHTSNPNGR